MCDIILLHRCSEFKHGSSEDEVEKLLPLESDVMDLLIISSIIHSWCQLLVKAISNSFSSSLPADLEIHQAQADPVDLFHPVGRNLNVN